MPHGDVVLAAGHDGAAGVVRRSRRRGGRLSGRAHDDGGSSSGGGVGGGVAGGSAVSGSAVRTRRSGQRVDVGRHVLILSPLSAVGVQ